MTVAVISSDFRLSKSCRFMKNKSSQDRKPENPEALRYITMCIKCEILNLNLIWFRSTGKYLLLDFCQTSIRSEITHLEELTVTLRHFEGKASQ